MRTAAVLLAGAGAIVAGWVLPAWAGQRQGRPAGLAQGGGRVSVSVQSGGGVSIAARTQSNVGTAPDWRRFLVAADKALAEGNLYQACAHARMAKGLAGPAQQEAVDGLLSRINVEADKSLTAANQLFQAGRSNPAIRTYQWLSCLAPLPTAAAAAARLRSSEVRGVTLQNQATALLEAALSLIRRQREALEATGPGPGPPGAQAAAADDAGRPAPATGPAEPTDADVVAAMPPERQGHLLGLLRTICAAYAGTPAFDQARPLLLELANDQRIADSVGFWRQEQQVAGKLDLARTYAWNRLYGHAARCYQEVIDAAPDSLQAAAAACEKRRLPARPAP